MTAPPDRRALLALLIGMGALWGITNPLAKIAVSDGYRAFGITFWTLVYGAVLITGICLLTRRRLPIHRRALGVYLFIALCGTLLPNAASYTAAVHLPSGIMSIAIATVPLMSFPMAMALGTDRFSMLRLFGLLIGMVAILMIALPEASLPDASMVAWLPVALIAPVFYAFEGNAVAKWGTAGLDPLQTLWGAMILGSALCAPAAILSGSWIDPTQTPWVAPDWAILAIACAHALAYCGYVWLVGRAGAVFTSQVGYLVTGFGIVWAKVILGETYSGWVWAALALMVLGVFLVQPRRAADIKVDDAVAN